ncbi:MAG: hypothetical protein WEC59_01240 [Salibacteraceae bacterium]
MEDLKQDINYMSNEVQKYLESEVKLAKLEFIDQLSAYSAFIFGRVVLSMMIGFSYLLVIVAFGIYLYPLFQEPWIGPAIAAGTSIVFLIILGLGRKHLLEGPVQDIIIGKLSKTFLS